MRRLIEFIVAHSNIFIFLIYSAISLTMLFSFNPYQSSVFFTTANNAVGKYYTYTGHISGYFGLRDINKELQKQNSALKIEVARLTEEVKKLKGEITFEEKYATDTIVGPVAYGIAQVVNVTTAYAYNYVTINKGSADGITEGMGVINHDGVVGITSAVSPHFSVVISLLNPKLRLSCKIKGSEYFGSLTWDGQSPEYMMLEELPRHVTFARGDTVVTSGYSSSFPEGLTVGTVEDFNREEYDDNFYAVRVKLSTDYFRMGDVCIIDLPSAQEQMKLEKEKYQR